MLANPVYAGAYAYGRTRREICASMRASASLTRCLSLIILSNVDILYLRGKVQVDQNLINFSAFITTVHAVQQQNARIDWIAVFGSQSVVENGYRCISTWKGATAPTRR